MLTRFHRVALFGILATALILALPARESDAQFPTICRAHWTSMQFDDGNQPHISWRVSPLPQGYWYTWNWTVTFRCDNGNFSNCAEAGRASVQSYDPATDTYGPEDTGSCASSNYIGCSTNNNTVSFTTTYPGAGGVLAPGTVFKINFYAAEWDGAIQGCADQSYHKVLGVVYTVPAAP